MLIWSPIFETKIAIIDEQHKKLFDLVNELTQEITHPQATEERFDQILNGLFSYAEQHFTDEENVIVEYKLSEKYLSLHRMEHKSFAYDIIKMRERISRNDDLTMQFDKLTRFLTSWLVYHTLRIDLLIPRQIIEMKKGKSAEEAYEIAVNATTNPEVTKKVLSAVLHLWEEAVDRIHALETQLAHEHAQKS